MSENEKNVQKQHKAKPTAPQPLVAHPLRDADAPRELAQFSAFSNMVAGYFPSLKRSLAQADMNFTAPGFVKYSMASAIYLSLILLVATWILLRENEFALLFCVLLLPVYYVVMFIYSMQLPGVKAHIRAKRMEQELVFAGRHMLIELKSGIPLYDSLLGVSRDYGEVSAEFNKIVEKVTLGVPLGVALHDVAENNPSSQFKRMILQMANSVASGSDVVVALESSLDQISKEQVIELKAYGQKLNPIVMFFMIFGVIMPSLGVAFLIILASFLGGAGMSFGSSALFGILVAVALIQFIFLSMIESSRPKFDM